jgi:nucleoid DNA-binding protein
MKNLTDIATGIGEVNTYTKTTAKGVLEQALTVISAHLADGEEVNLPGFGKFATSRREARMGRNPKTGEATEIPATNVVKFKPAKALKDSVK